MTYLYITCLTFGLVYSVVTLILGEHHGIFHHDLGEIGTDGIEGISPFKPIVIGTFITFFGGFGIIGHYTFKLAALLVVLLAVAAGLVAGSIIFFGIVRTMYKSQSNSTVSAESLRNTIGDVITPIPSKGLGEIAYTAGGVKYNSPAKSLEEDEIPKGSKIAIVEVKDNVASVIKSPEI